jgi:O-antigen/teichoic acid export membrane protein
VKPSSLTNASVLQGGGRVLLGLVVWNAANYAFFLLTGRELGPSDYGLVAALLAATVAVAVPAQGLQFATARLVAAPPGSEAELAEGIYRRSRHRCAAATAVFAVAASAVLVAVDMTGHEISLGPLLMTVALMTPLGFFFLALGRLQGDERFTAFSLSFILWGVPRPVMLVVLAALGLGVYAGLGAACAAMAAALSASLWFARRTGPAREPSVVEWRAFTRPVVPLVVGLSGLGLLTNLDVIVAKVALSPDSAGQFAAAATFAKAVFLLPQAIAFVLLPQVAARSAAAQDTGILLGLGLGVTLIAGGLASLVIWLIAEPLLRVTYGEDFTGSAGLLGAYAGACTLIGALIVVIIHHVGRGADRYVWAAAGLALLQGLLFLVLHGSPRTIIAVDAIVGGTGLLLHECMFFRTGEAILPGFVRAARRGRDLRNEAA